MRAALIGKPLGHSYSKIIHEKFGYGYDLLPIEPEEIEDTLKSGMYGGFNVTVPYKREVMKYLDEVDDTALKIGAVNTVKAEGGKLIGYNTDLGGMEYMLISAGVHLRGKRVMILGTGGSSRTANALANKLGASEIVTVGRTSAVNYSNCHECDPEVIINTTPVGMYPDFDACPIDISGFPNLSAVADIVYNPLNTDLLLSARDRGIAFCGGLGMLVSQAVYASEIFTGMDRKTEIPRILREIRGLACGVVFIGMPGSGKSTLGKYAAELLNKKFVDTDAEIEKIFAKPVSAIFSENGEEAFRNAETEVIRDAARENAVVSTGGGAVLRAINRKNIRRNSLVIHVKRDLEKLETAGRPLSASTEKLYAMQCERMPIYRDLADFCVDNNGEPDEAKAKIKEYLL